jgi:5-methyltetrahydropteroyltriglutamate--homocysteine methyltransferase
VEIREGQASQAFVAPTSDCGHDHSAPAGHTPAQALATASAPSQEPEQSWKYVPKNVFTTARLSCPAPIVVADFRYVQGCTQRVAKITLPSPTRLHFHGGRGTVSRQAYPDEEEFFADVATIYQNEIAALEAAGCRYIQIDDPLMTYFISERLRDEVRQSGDDPDKRLARYVRLTNECIAQRRPDTAVGIHVCRGNSRSGWISEGGYERIAEAVFGGLQCDHLMLEYDDERSGDFQPLRHVPADRRVVLGLVTTKRGALESADDLRRRIDEASAYVDLDRLAISPQCGFASVVEGNLITHEDQWAKLRLVTEVARRVWG